jgi:O-antigen/teichoic acid export membrane protein
MTMIQEVRHRFKSWRKSETARLAVLNGACGVTDYIAQPLGMLLAAPFLIHRLGISQYGLWMIASAVVGSSGLLSTGFSDMAVKYVAMYRSRGDWSGVVRVVQCSMGINLVLGTVIAALLWIAAPFAGHHVFKVSTDLQSAFIRAIRIGSIVLVVRSLDSIFVSILRAYEQYRPAVQITVCTRALTLISAVMLAAYGRGLVDIMLATLTVNAGGMILQALAVRRHVGHVSFRPSWNDELLPAVSAFGCFSWLQALSGIIFGQVDRLIVGALLGSSSVAYYSICTQAAQPIHGLIASGFNFLFPHLSARHPTSRSRDFVSVVTVATCLNIANVILLCLPLVLFSKAILTAWLGAPFAGQESTLLSVVAIGYALAGINVTGHYTLMAMGAIKYVMFLNLLAGAAMVGAITLLTSHYGLMGAAEGRLIYGPITWLAYYKIYKLLRSGHDGRARTPSLLVAPEET